MRILRVSVQMSEAESDSDAISNESGSMTLTLIPVVHLRFIFRLFINE